MSQEQSIISSVDTGEEKPGDVQVEIVEDVPPEDRGKPTREQLGDAKIPSDDEIEKYDDEVKDRIRRLRFEFHTERREKEAAIRQSNEAVNYAARVAEENKRLASMLNKTDVALINQGKAKATSEFEAAKKAYEAAYEAGDSKSLLAAQEQMVKAQVDKDRWEHMPIPPEQKPAPAAAPAPAPQAETKFTPNELEVEWLQKNTWFTKDDEMTSLALGVHQKLVKSGVQPGTKEYFAQVDQRMRQVFPDHFPQGSGQEKSSTTTTQTATARRTPAVAPVAREGSAPRKVQLTASEVALARRLGVSPEDYAREKMKQEIR